MSEFERTKTTIGNRTIMVTSWYDDSKHTWRASAPAYAHLSTLLSTPPLECPSREAAVTRLHTLLTGYFGEKMS